MAAMSATNLQLQGQDSSSRKPYGSSSNITALSNALGAIPGLANLGLSNLDLESIQTPSTYNTKGGNSKNDEEFSIKSQYRTLLNLFSSNLLPSHHSIVSSVDQLRVIRGSSLAAQSLEQAAKRSRKGIYVYMYY